MLSHLQPELLWKWFSQICSIPHSSYNDEDIVIFVENWAKGQNLEVLRDNANNLLLRKAATKGFEQVPSVCLQAHFDMVPQKTPESNHDFLLDPIKPQVVGEHVYATNTTLGADNGIGLAAILALFEDDSFEHGPLEAILTRNEEVGMEGALSLDPTIIKSKLMINTDTEEWGSIYLGCAGGVDVTYTKVLPASSISSNVHLYELKVSGLQGGHSGCDIHKPRLNAIKVGFDLANKLFESTPFGIVTAKSGTARNAIPRDFTLLLAIDSERSDILTSQFAKLRDEYLATFSEVEKGIALSLTQQNKTVSQVLSSATTKQLLDGLNKIPNGVIDTLKEGIFAGTVETSLSVGILNIDTDTGLKYKILARSLDNDKLNKLVVQLKEIAAKHNFECQDSGQYSGWKPESNWFSEYVVKEYQNLTGKDVLPAVIHAGLECGIIKGIYPDVSIVSVGPNIYNPHTPTESVEIASVANFYQLLKNILSNLK